MQKRLTVEEIQSDLDIIEHLEMQQRGWKFSIIKEKSTWFQVVSDGVPLVIVDNGKTAGKTYGKIQSR